MVGVQIKEPYHFPFYVLWSTPFQDQLTSLAEFKDLA